MKLSKGIWKNKGWKTKIETKKKRNKRNGSGNRKKYKKTCKKGGFFKKSVQN